jgi:hypothetical protein
VVKIVVRFDRTGSGLSGRMSVALVEAQSQWDRGFGWEPQLAIR